MSRWLLPGVNLFRRLTLRRRVTLGGHGQLLTLAAEQAEREQNTRTRVAQGKTVEDVLAEFGRI